MGNDIFILGGLGVATYFLSSEMQSALKKASKMHLGGGGSGGYNIFNLGKPTSDGGMFSLFGQQQQELNSIFSNQQQLLTNQIQKTQNKIKDTATAIEKGTTAKIANLKKISKTPSISDFIKNGFEDIGSGIFSGIENTGISFAYSIGSALGFNTPNISEGTFSRLTKSLFGNNEIAKGGIPPATAKSFITGNAIQTVKNKQPATAKRVITKTSHYGGGGSSYSGSSFSNNNGTTSQKVSVAVQQNNTNYSKFQNAKNYLTKNPIINGAVNKAPSFWSSPISYIKRNSWSWF